MVNGEELRLKRRRVACLSPCRHIGRPGLKRPTSQWYPEYSGFWQRMFLREADKIWKPLQSAFHHRRQQLEQKVSWQYSQSQEIVLQKGPKYQTLKLLKQIQWQLKSVKSKDPCIKKRDRNFPSGMIRRTWIRQRPSVVRANLAETLRITSSNLPAVSARHLLAVVLGTRNWSPLRL